MDPGITDSTAPPGAPTDASASIVPDVDVSQMSYMDVLLHDAVSNGTTCTIYLANGIKLVGKVLAVDAPSILFQSSSNVPFAINRTQVATFLPPGASGVADGQRRR